MALLSRPRGRFAGCSAVVLLAVAGTLFAPAAAVADDSPSRFTLKDRRIDESSGLAASHAHKGVYWTHNDSDDGPYIYAVDGKTGKTVATVTLRGVDPRDVEAISVGPDGRVYVGDIGDNFGGRWPEVWIRSFPEPKELRDVTVDPTTYTVKYADGPRDAESLMVHPRTGRVYIASKNNEGKGGIYEGPARLSSSGVNVFRRIARTEVWATDGAFSPDGTRLVLRGYMNGEMYAWKDGRPSPLGTQPVPTLGQGESVTFTPDGRTLMYGSEGRGSSVDPVELSGKMLPESVRAKSSDEGSPSPDDSKHSGDKGDENGAKDDGGNGGNARNLVLAGVVFAVGLGVWTGLKRIFGRRD
ncbi:hypothetical protein [Streptomyces sp. ODS28]|uniref:hypothetical protein n=1 Tax=Streptomyces sp. ODS28 TaxID=3136688 RepID=UPI0031E74AA1